MRRKHGTLPCICNAWAGDWTHELIESDHSGRCDHDPGQRGWLKGACVNARPDPKAQQPEDAVNPGEISSLAEFYDLASPSTDAEKVLVVGYWFQFREGAQELEALKINNQLKHLGHGVGNVSRALELHKTQRPALMIQKRKEGATKQARKKFAVTNEGKKYVEKMFAKA
jgi:hypothetical protein